MAKEVVAAERTCGAREIRIDQIDKGPAPIRTHVNREALDELKQSIEKLGLLQPIVVMERVKPKAGQRRYSLVVGSRRVQAYEELEREDIPAIIIQEQNRERILAATLAENICRSDLNHREMAPAVTELYRLYGRDTKKVAKATAIWPETVLRYVYLQEYGTPQMVDWVDKKKISLLDVKRVLKAVEWNIKKAERWLEIMVKEEMTPTQRRNLAEYVDENPSPTQREAVSDAKKPRVKRRLLVDLTPEIQDGIKKAMGDWKIGPEEVAVQALHDWLEDQGYIE